MRHFFDQYYYTAAPDLFDTSRKSGWGIFGSSTPDDPGKNEKIEQISKEWVPMRLLEEEAFPVEYVMYVDDRYVAGGVTSCSTLIKGDNRPNIWTHVLLPDQTGTASFLSCLCVRSFDKVQRQEEKMILSPLEIEEIKEDGRAQLKSWASKASDAALLKAVLTGLSGLGKTILITDEDLEEDDFEQYQALARAMMRHIYHLIPGSLRRELSFIAPMVPKYFQLASEKPKGARFYFGPEDQYDTVISMQQGYELTATNFYDAVLLKMMDLYHENPELYEEIGSQFRKNSYAMRENDYIWHFIFEMAKRKITFNWSLFGEKEYLDAYNQAWNDAEKQSVFLKLTDILRKEKPEFCISQGCFSIFCRMLRVFGDGLNAGTMEQAVNWMLDAENLQPSLRKEFLHVLSDSNIAENLVYTMKYTLMQKSEGFLQEAREILNELDSAEEMEQWWQDYAPMKERFQTDLEQKLETLFMTHSNTEERKELLRLDETILEQKVRRKLRNRILFEVQIVSLSDPHAWEKWKENEESLKILDSRQYEEKQKLWRNEFWQQVDKNDILLEPVWRHKIRQIAEDLEIKWEKVCEYFAADMSNASLEWGENEVKESRKLARHLEPSLGVVFEEICDDAQARIEQERRNERIARVKAYNNQALLDLLRETTSPQEKEDYFQIAASRIYSFDRLKNDGQFQLLLGYAELHGISAKMQDQFWKLCTREWFPSLLSGMNSRIAEKILRGNVPVHGVEFLIYKDAIKRIDKEAKHRISKNAVKLSSKEREEFLLWFEEQDAGQENLKLVARLFAQGGGEQLTENMRLVVSSVFWTALNLAIYEGIQKAEDFGIMTSIGLWAGTMVVTIILLFTAIRHQRKIPKLVILLISSFFWTACAAIMKVMFGLFGEMAYLGILFVVMLILTLTNTDREES
ncbi:MAG TPA: hypothetical protein IAC33_09500 [Candidatus Fimousia stercorigallinarum]|nr:hypothetical protein [Candidatus Fimousia stercorigallinarum]